MCKCLCTMFDFRRFHCIIDYFIFFTFDRKDLCRPVPSMISLYRITSKIRFEVLMCQPSRELNHNEIFMCHCNFDNNPHLIQNTITNRNIFIHAHSQVRCTEQPIEKFMF